jgi:hypothetical protein
MCILGGHLQKDQGWAFLDGGSAPLEHDEDSPAIMSVATPVVGKDGRTCKTPNRCVAFINIGTTLVPYESGDTSMRQGYISEPIDSLTSVQGHFNQRALTAIPACLLKMSPSKGRASRGREWVGRVTSPNLFVFILVFVILPRGLGLGGGAFPRSPHRRPGGNLGPSPLPLYL